MPPRVFTSFIWPLPTFTVIWMSLPVLHHPSPRCVPLCAHPLRGLTSVCGALCHVGPVPVWHLNVWMDRHIECSYKATSFKWGWFIKPSNTETAPVQAFESQSANVQLSKTVYKLVIAALWHLFVVCLKNVHISPTGKVILSCISCLLSYKEKKWVKHVSPVWTCILNR